MTPKVSIVVPVYHVEPYLERCLETLIHQTLTEIEIILVDDGSKDRCGEICDEYAAHDKRIVVIHKENQGLGLARNTGIENATGEYIGFVDSDDYVSVDMFQILYEAAVKENADMVLSGICHVGGIMFQKQQDQKEFRHCLAQTEIFSGSPGIQKLMLGVVGSLPQEGEDSRYGFSVCKNLYRRSILQQHQIRFNSERVLLSEDVVFLLDFLPRIQKAVGIPGAYYFYCRNADSLSKGFREDRFPRYLNLIAFLKEKLEAVADKQQVQLYTDRQVIAAARVSSIQEILHSFEVKMPASQLKERLFRICTQSEVAAVLKRYPFYQLPKMQACFAFAMRYRLTLLQKLMVYMRQLF